MQDDAHRRGKSIDEIKEGDSLTVTECISERELLIYSFFAVAFDQIMCFYLH